MQLQEQSPFPIPCKRIPTDPNAWHTLDAPRDGVSQLLFDVESIGHVIQSLSDYLLTGDPGSPENLHTAIARLAHIQIERLDKARELMEEILTRVPVPPDLFKPEA